MKLMEMTGRDYLAQLGSDAPAPGGGSASALCGAQGAGLLAMVAGLTLGKKGYESVQEQVAALQSGAQEVMEQLILQVDLDTDAFCLVSSAYRMAKGTEEEKLARRAAIQHGTLVSTQVPLQTMLLALKALELGQCLLEGFNVNAASDLGVAAWNLRSCLQGAWYNVCINVPGLADRETAEELRRQGSEALEKGMALAEKLQIAAEKAIGL